MVITKVKVSTACGISIETKEAREGLIPFKYSPYLAKIYTIHKLYKHWNFCRFNSCLLIIVALDVKDKVHAVKVALGVSPQFFSIWTRVLNHNKYVAIKQFSKEDIKQNNISTVILLIKFLVNQWDPRHLQGSRVVYIFIYTLYSCSI